MHPPDAAALAYLQRLSRFGMRLGLERMRAILARLDHPQRAFAAVHVAGTNGKGSTAAMLAAIARAAGLRVGLYTSPHLVSFHERIVVDGRPITPEELAQAFEAVRRAVEAESPVEPPTHFEFTTAMAFWHMARAGVELAVVEVGLGGRLDATNVLEPCLCVITPVGLDHTQVLGPTVAAVAAEKAGIVKPGVPVVVAPQPAEAMAVIEERCRRMGSPLYPVEEAAFVEKASSKDGADPGADAGATPWPDARCGWHPTPRPASPAAGRPGEPAGVYRYQVLSVDLEGGWLRVAGPPGWQLDAVRVALLGRHQVQNAAVALAAAHRLACGGWPLTAAAMREGLAAVRWPTRLQVLAQDPWLILDGAHNPPAAGALTRAVRELFGTEPPVLVVGMLAEKDVAAVLARLVHPGAVVVATRARSGRTEPAHPEQLARLARQAGAARALAVAPACAAVDAALRMARAMGGAGPVVVTGSLYLAGELLAGWDSAGIDTGCQ